MPHAAPSSPVCFCDEPGCATCDAISAAIRAYEQGLRVSDGYRVDEDCAADVELAGVWAWGK